MEDLMTPEQIEFERELAAEQQIEDQILAEAEFNDERETTFEEQYENEQFAQDGDFENMHPSEEFEGCWEN